MPCHPPCYTAPPPRCVLCPPSAMEGTTTPLSTQYLCHVCGSHLMASPLDAFLTVAALVSQVQERFEVDIKALPEQIDTSTYSQYLEPMPWRLCPRALRPCLGARAHHLRFCTSAMLVLAVGLMAHTSVTSLWERIVWQFDMKQAFEQFLYCVVAL